MISTLLRKPGKLIAALLALLVIAYVAVPLFYVWTLSGHDHRPPQGGEVQPPPIV